MVSKTVKEVFHIIQGTQITEEEIYHMSGDIPIYTGQNKIVGYTNKALIKKEDLPVISYPTKGKVGNMYYKDQLFSANNTAILVLKDEYKGKVNLMWFIYTQKQAFKRASNSQFGVAYLGLHIVERITFDLPDKSVQDRVEKQYRELMTLRQKLMGVIDQIDEILSLTVKPSSP